MKRLPVFARTASILCVTTLLCSCAASSEKEEARVDEDTSQQALTGPASQLGYDASWRARWIESLKTRIVAIAKANQTRTDNFAEVTTELRPFVDRLLLIAPKRSQAEKLSAVQGTWYGLWSNLGYVGASPDLTRIFQVVRNGYYYNLSDFLLPNGQSSIGALRGAFAPIPNSLAIRFTRNGFLPGSLAGKTGAEIAAIADSIEGRETAIRDIPGPIGVTGELSVLYVDDTLRISGGSQTPVFDDKGNVVVPGQFDLLFVLERLEGTAP